MLRFGVDWVLLMLLAGAVVAVGVAELRRQMLSADDDENWRSSWPADKGAAAAPATLEDVDDGAKNVEGNCCDSWWNFDNEISLFWVSTSVVVSSIQWFRFMTINALHFDTHTAEVDGSLFFFWHRTQYLRIFSQNLLKLSKLPRLFHAWHGSDCVFRCNRAHSDEHWQKNALSLFWDDSRSRDSSVGFSLLLIQFFLFFFFSLHCIALARTRESLFSFSRNLFFPLCCLNFSIFTRFSLFEGAFPLIFYM